MPDGHVDHWSDSLLELGLMSGEAAQSAGGAAASENLIGEPSSSSPKEPARIKVVLVLVDAGQGGFDTGEGAGVEVGA